MKKVGFPLLSFLTGIYFTMGGFSIFVYYVSFFIIKLGHRDFLINSDEKIIPPYPLGLAVGFYASLIAFLGIGYILIHVTVKNSKYLNSKAILKFTLFVILVLCGFFVARGGIYVWEATPPMSKERAIQIAIEENKSDSDSIITSEYSRNIYRSIQWDKINHMWIVEFSDQRGVRCNHISITRLGTSVTGGSCHE